MIRSSRAHTDSHARRSGKRTNVTALLPCRPPPRIRARQSNNFLTPRRYASEAQGELPREEMRIVPRLHVAVLQVVLQLQLQVRGEPVAHAQVESCGVEAPAHRHAAFKDAVVKLLAEAHGAEPLRRQLVLRLRVIRDG